MNFLAEVPGVRITSTVTEHDSLVLAESTQTTTGTASDADFQAILEKNRAFYSRWTFDPRPMVIRFRAKNLLDKTKTTMITVDFTDGDSVGFAKEKGDEGFWYPMWNHPLTLETGRTAVRVADIARKVRRKVGLPSSTMSDFADLCERATRTMTSSTGTGHQEG